MTTVRNKSRYDKEMSAITYNLKEQRVLEKSMQTLKLEQTYAMKLLELDNRIIKVHYKKLKEKVSKIKSHLPPEDISKFRDLDQRGKLKPTISGVSSSGAIKIAAASRRLNLGGTPGSGSGDRRRRCVRSAVPRISVENGDTDGNMNSQRNLNSPEMGVLHRSNSVTGAFIDAPEPEPTRRPGSASVLLRKSKNNSLGVSERPATASVPHLNPLPHPSEKHRPTTSVRYSIRESHDELDADDDEDHNNNNNNHNNFMIKRPTGMEKRPSTTPHSQQTHSPFSSHTTAEKEARSNGLPVPSRSQMGRRMSHVSNDSIDSNLGDNLFEERRQELLEEESVRAATLDKRTQMFLKDVDDYIQKNPPLQPSHMAFEAVPRDLRGRGDSFENGQAESEARAKKNRHHIIGRRRNDRPVSAENVPTFFPEEQYKEKLLTMWKDLNKCRYLRMPDERIDLSGVNTLVKDQMKLFETLRNAEAAPITHREDD